MVETTLEIRNPSGLHARPAAVFVKAASEFAADIRITNLTRDPGRVASARSILGVLGLGVARGHSVRLTAEGADAEEAIRALSDLVASGVGDAIDGEEA